MEDDDIPDTRVFVSGLPPNFTSDQLGAHFAGRYQITDAVVIEDRRIGFVGFRNYTLAQSAIKYFNKTYIRMSKISVEMAKPVEIKRTSTSQGVPLSKHSAQAKAHRPSSTQLIQSSGHSASNAASNHDTAFQDYVPVVASKRKRESASQRENHYLEPTPGVSAALVTSECENGGRGSPADEKVGRRLKMARMKDKEKDEVRKADTEGRHEDENGHHQHASETSGTKRKKKKIEVDAQGLADEDVAALGPEDVTKDPAMKRKKSNKKKREEARNSKDAPAVEEEKPTRDENHVSKEKMDPRPRDHDGKGGVAPFADDLLEPSEQSADQSTQQRRRGDTVNDNEWLRAKTNRLLGLLDEASQDARSAFLENRERSNMTTSTPGVEVIEQLPTPSSDLFTESDCTNLPSSGRLFVRNLPYTATESDLEALFSKYGQLHEVRLVRDKAGNSKGYGYISFSDEELSRHALQQLDGKSFQGRLLHILETTLKDSHRLNDYEILKLPIKQQKSLRRRLGATGSTFSWNSMYMNPNAVLSSVADRLGVRRADLIDAQSSDAAVKQAHAETHVIQETKTFLSSNGVNLDAFKQKERDEMTLLVKNFPYGTTAEELKCLFGPYGEIARFLLPPSGTTAIIQFAQTGDGRQAMRHLAYRNFKGSVLYLEYAPKNLFNNSNQSLPQVRPADEPPAAEQEGSKFTKAEESPSSTLFVRNLNFTTTTSGLADAFRPLSGFLSAKVKTKIDPRRPREVLSMGFGFVEFSSNQQARAALETMNHKRLDEHELLVQISRKTIDVAEEQRNRDNLKKAEAHKTKIIIKNLPFEATKKDVRALLSAYGQLRSVKVPQKFDRSTRGFAFADFVTAKEAENAMEALKDTHLLGRRLVLEFAAEESIDPEQEIRAIESKVGRQTEMVHLSKMTGSARRKFNAGLQDDDQE